MRKEQSCLVNLSVCVCLGTATKITLDKIRALTHKSKVACRQLYLCTADRPGQSPPGRWGEMVSAKVDE
jgi:hypothetical protein